MSSEIAIKAENLSKCYEIYAQPHDRLKQSIYPRIQRLFGKTPAHYYREFWALKDISFEVKKGETVGIIGRNGSGKSTLLQIVCNTLNATSGSIQTKGRIAALLELGSGFNPEFTGRENVYMNAAILGLTKAETDAKFDAIAAFADIGQFLDQPVKTYSTGMQVRLAFAVATTVDPDILIVDEALAVGDVRFQLKCHRRFDEFREMRKTILLVSHSCGDVVRLCSKAIWLDGGKTRKAGIAKTIAEEYSAWMVHDVGVQQAPVAVVAASSPGNRPGNLAPIPGNACITGEGGATINAVGLFAEDHRRITILNGSAKVRLIFEASTKVSLDHPYFAFQIVNAKGLRVLGSNTFVLKMKIPRIEAGRRVSVQFSFTFPELENGPYLIALGIADGTPDKHIRHVFIADAHEINLISASIYQTQAVLLKIPNCLADVHVT